ncbi:GntR family transcriptional regulator [Rhodococcoides kyotonense]|uniref:DNA-binding transcriptional regulator, GntR family n=1 Tax=Rhodococcoides kyotonense TaxID=398843 RepID=A0A239MX56_9NOCA|nr:GntR family transcriptional regulator [Rhodococcus kyotonensis]SNT47331.1 DNA-binding transcriptional regulator, GntR family [Rhodococcus kyotonensis]
MQQSETPWRGKAETVYEQLRTDIETGVLEPGQVLPEHDLVTYTGASRTPIREALRRLAGDGLIDLAPRRAPAVSRISLRSARALFDFRRLLEPAAIRMVTVKARDSTALRDDILNLLDRFRDLRELGSAGDDTASFLTLTAAFDQLLADHTPNEYLKRSILDLRPHSARLRNIAHSDRSRIPHSIDEHIRMCVALLDGDSDAASGAMIAHLDLVDRAIFRNLLGGESADILMP